MNTTDIVAHNLATIRAIDTDKMERAFSLVSPDKRATALLGHSNHGVSWKDRISSLLPQSTLDAAGVSIEDVREAVSFYTATEAKVAMVRVGLVGTVDHKGARGYLVEAAGYRAGPAGDH